LTVKKLSKTRFFTIKIYYISSQNDPNITHTKNLGDVRRLASYTLAYRYNLTFTCLRIIIFYLVYHKKNTSTSTRKSYISQKRKNCGEEAQIETIRLVYFGLPH
jgi:hypothetical protein